MKINITTCHKVNVADSCALWNILSSQIFYAVLADQRFEFSCTDFVIYECLHRARSVVTAHDEQIKRRLKKLIDGKKITAHKLTIEDLQDEQVLANRRSLGRGELSSIAFAKKTHLCFLTDDQKARKIAGEILGSDKVQTTPLLLVWLLYMGFLTDGDLEPVIKEHLEAVRPLEAYFRAVHRESWRIKSLPKPD